MVVIPKRGEDPEQPGPWWARIETAGGEPWPYPQVCCPEGHVAGLGDHDIEEDGTVKPSLVCPTGGCSYHVWAKLDGWT